MPLFDPSNLGEYFHGLFVGPNGQGKTLAAVSFYKRYIAKKQKIWLADIDGRTEPIKLFCKLGIFEPTVLQEMLIIDEYNPSNYERFIVDFNKRKEDPTIGLMILDSLTSASMTVVNFQMIKKGANNKLTKGGLAVPTWDEINGETQQISQLLDDIKQLKKDVIWTAHPVNKMDISEGAAPVKYQSIASFGHKLPSLVPNYFNEIYGFGYEGSVIVGQDGERVVKTAPTDFLSFAKTALPLPKTLTITKKRLYDVIKDNLKTQGIEF